MDWEKERTRALLGNLAGMSEEELAALSDPRSAAAAGRRSDALAGKRHTGGGEFHNERRPAVGAFGGRFV